MHLSQSVGDLLFLAFGDFMRMYPGVGLFLIHHVNTVPSFQF